MKTYQLVEKGQLLKITTNKSQKNDTFKLYKISNDNTLTDITPDNVEIKDIGYGYKRVEVNAPNEDCYVCAIFNDISYFTRVGSPTIKAFFYSGIENQKYRYILRKFNDIDNPDKKDFIEIGKGIYVTEDLPDTGDWIFEVYDENDNLLVAPIPIHVPYITNFEGLSGKIRFEKDMWQLCAIPLKGKTIYEGVVKPIEEKYNVKGEDIFIVFNAYPATPTQSREFLSFVPGITSLSSKHNFKLVYEDKDANEITGWWVKTKNYDLKDENGNEIIVELEWQA